MIDNSRTLLVTTVGAFIGAAAAYLFFTDEGQRLRRQIEPALDSAADELSSLRSSVQRAVGVASESWNLLNETFQKSGAAYPRYSNPHQTTPF